MTKEFFVDLLKLVGGIVGIVVGCVAVLLFFEGLGWLLDCVVQRVFKPIARSRFYIGVSKFFKGVSAVCRDTCELFWCMAMAVKNRVCPLMRFEPDPDLEAELV